MIARVVETYNKKARWSNMLGDKPKWSQEEIEEAIVLFERMYLEGLPQNRAATLFRKKFPWRSRCSVMGKLTKMTKGTGVVFQLMLRRSSGEASLPSTSMDVHRLLNSSLSSEETL